MKKITSMIALTVFMAVIPSCVLAQCAPGIPGGGNPSCVPPDVFYNSLPPGSPPPDLGPQWETRWGSIAMGGGGFGASTNMPSKRKAQKVALDQCRQTGGGKQCKVSLSYQNQCGSVAVGNTPTGNLVSYYRAIDTEYANKLALEDCSKDAGGTCRIYYAGCSYPVRTR